MAQLPGPGGMPPGLPMPGAPAPQPAMGPTPAAPTAGGPAAGKVARVAVLAGTIMKALLSAASQVDPQSEEAKALVGAYQKLAGTFKGASGALEQSELAAMGRAAEGGPGVYNDQQKEAFLSALKAGGGVMNRMAA